MTAIPRLSRFVAMLALPLGLGLLGCSGTFGPGGPDDEQAVSSEGPAVRVPAPEPGDSREERERKRAAREAATEDYWHEREAWGDQGGY